MTRTAVGVCVVLLLGCATLSAQAPKPYPELKTFEPLIGEWIQEGEAVATPLGPAGKTSAKFSIRWILNGFFVEWQYSYVNPTEKVEGREIDGYDPNTKTFPGRWVESNGLMTTGVYARNGNVLTFNGTTTTATRKYELRQTYVFAADFASYTFKSEICLDGKTWLPDTVQKGTKVKPAQK